MTFEYQKLKNTVLDEVNFYDPISRSYPLEERAFQLLDECYAQCDVLIRNLIHIAETILTSNDPPERNMLQLELIMDIAAKIYNLYRLCAEIDPLRDIGQKEKEPLEVNRENS